MKQETEIEGKERGFSLWWIVAVLALYLAPFVVILIDEKVFRTFWFAKHLPGWAGDILRLIYPFHELFN